MVVQRQVQVPPLARQRSVDGVQAKSEEEETQRLKDLVTIIAKLSMQNALAARTLRAITMLQNQDNIDVGNSLQRRHDRIREYDQAVQRAECSERDSERRDGHPSIHGFTGLLKCYVSLVNEQVKALYADPSKGEGAQIAETKWALLKASIGKWTW